ncbi:MAG: hypothetical protein J0G29_05085 [Alphaproteobacteria bacterium]|nr:hypothetical protein [Alphaproteobacteria bacterium]
MYRRMISVGIVVSILVTTLHSTAFADFQRNSWLEALAPGYLVPDALERVKSYTGAPEEQAIFEKVDGPILKGVLGRIIAGLSAEGNGTSLSQSMDRVASYQALLGALRFAGSEQTADLAPIEDTLSKMHPDMIKRFISDSRHYGRWSEFSTTISQPWVWDRVGMDVFGMSKIVPFGIWILDDEKKRNNLGGVNNELLRGINWFYFGYKLTQVNVPMDVAIGHLANDTMQLLDNVYHRNVTAISEEWRVNYYKYAHIFSGVGVMEELLADLGEAVRGPAVVVVLIGEGEYSLAVKAVKSYFGEIYDLLNRNRKFFTLHPQGSAYLYAVLNLFALPLLVFDFDNFYWKDSQARFDALLEQEPFTPKFYGDLFIWMGKALTPVFVTAQLYDEKMVGYTHKVLTFMAAHTPVIGPGLERIFTVHLRNFVGIPAVAQLLSWLSVWSGLSMVDTFMRAYGAPIYNFGIWLTGSVGTVLAGTFMFYRMIDNKRMELTQATADLAVVGVSALTSLFYSAEMLEFMKNIGGRITSVEWVRGFGEKVVGLLPAIQNAPGWLYAVTGAFGWAVTGLGIYAVASYAIPAIIESFVVANPASVVTTCAVAVYMLMYTSKAKTTMIRGVSVHQIFARGQTAVMSVGLILDHIVIPILNIGVVQAYVVQPVQEYVIVPTSELWCSYVADPFRNSVKRMQDWWYGDHGEL